MIEIALFAQTAIWLATIAVFIGSKQASVFHPAMAYLLFHGLVFVVRPILVYYFNFDFCWHYMGFQPSNAIFVKTLAVTSLAMICPFQPSEKQALLEAGCLSDRARLMMTLLEITIAGQGEHDRPRH